MGVRRVATGISIVLALGLGAVIIFALLARVSRHLLIDRVKAKTEAIAGRPVSLQPHTVIEPVAKLALAGASVPFLAGQPKVTASAPCTLLVESDGAIVRVASGPQYLDLEGSSPLEVIDRYREIDGERTRRELIGLIWRWWPLLELVARASPEQPIDSMSVEDLRTWDYLLQIRAAMLEVGGLDRVWMETESLVIAQSSRMTLFLAPGPSRRCVVDVLVDYPLSADARLIGLFREHFAVNECSCLRPGER